MIQPRDMVANIENIHEVSNDSLRFFVGDSCRVPAVTGSVSSQINSLAIGYVKDTAEYIDIIN